jgi:hypothetical protein
MSILVPVTAQVATPPTGTSNLNAASRSSGDRGSGNTTINRHESAPPSAQGQEIPIIDPTSKTFEFQGRTYSMMDNNLGGQFEAYLASKVLGSKEALEYREKIEKIQDLLSPLNSGGPDFKSSYTLLEDASNFPGDGGICDSLANSVYSGRLVMKGIGNKKEAIVKLEKEHRRIVNNLGVLESKGNIGGATTAQRGKKKRKSKATQTTEYKVLQMRLREITAIKKKYTASGILSLNQSKVQYQALMLQLFIQRRFDHVIMSARFYNIIYKDGDQTMRIKKGSDTEKFFSEGLGVNPTVAGLDAAANEAIRKSQTLISAFENNISSNRIHAASERLVEAFLVGEFVPCVQTVSMDMKNRVQQYVEDAHDLVEALSVKELGHAASLNESLKTQASDYNPSKATSYIAGHKRASDGYVRDAKFALIEKDTARSKVAIENAIKHWPTNPSIKVYNAKLDQRLDLGAREADMGSQTIKEFDRLLADKNYRAMVEEPRKSQFVVVLGQSDDEVRLEQLTEIGDSIMEIEKALGKSQSLIDAGQPHAAWEAIFETQNKYYDDPKIANAKAQLIGQVGNFTNSLTKAKKLEEGRASPQTGSALSWYLKARDIYPQSKMAKEGIQRIVSKQFDTIAPQPPP